MLHRQSKTSPAAPAGEPRDLTRLLEAEARLEDMLRQAREGAARLVATARENAVSREAALAAELEAEANRLAKTLGAEYQRQATDSSAQATRQAERLDRVGAEPVTALARYVVGRVIEAGP